MGKKKKKKKQRQKQGENGELAKKKISRGEKKETEIKGVVGRKYCKWRSAGSWVLKKKAEKGNKENTEN